MFSKLQASYIDEQQKAFGYSPRRFALDMFNEVVPKSKDTKFLAQTSLQETGNTIIHKTFSNFKLFFPVGIGSTIATKKFDVGIARVALPRDAGLLAA